MSFSFGSNSAQQNTPFGSAAKPAFSFGSTNTATTSTAGFGGFGTTTSSAGFGAFGSTATSTVAPFGTQLGTTPASSAPSLFGTTAFGSTAAKPTTGFGAGFGTNTFGTGTAFGTGASTFGSAAPTFGTNTLGANTFGTTPNQGSTFGSAFGTKPATSGFLGFGTGLGATNTFGQPQLVAGDLMRLLSANESDQPLVVHGFSVGGYLWGEVCAHVMADKERYQPVLDRVAAQVWDSAADITEITIGVPIAVFPNNKIMQKTLKAYMEYHMKTFHDAATTHYIRSSQLFHTNLCRAPALFLLSSSDPVGAEHSNRAVYQSWCKMGIKCTWQCWDRSPHVQHFSKHREEYVRLVMAHLREHALHAHKTRAHA